MTMYIGVCDMNNFEWFHGIVMQGDCALVLEDDSQRLNDLVGDLKGVSNVLRILGGIGNKTIAECLFDFANMTNSTGGITGPGNSMWF